MQLLKLLPPGSVPVAIAPLGQYTRWSMGLFLGQRPREKDGGRANRPTRESGVAVGPNLSPPRLQIYAKTSGEF